MSTDTDLSPTIASAALDPAQVEVDGQVVMTRPISELIKADQYLACRAAITKRTRGIYFSKLLPAGPVSDQGVGRHQTFDRGGWY